MLSRFGRLQTISSKNITIAVGISPVEHYQRLREHFLKHKGCYARALDYVEGRLARILNTFDDAELSESLDEPMKAAMKALADKVRAGGGVQVIAARGVALRKRADKQSPKVTGAAQGEELAIPDGPVQLATTPSGGVRIQTLEGWTTAVTSAGVTLVVPLEPDEAAAMFSQMDTDGNSMLDSSEFQSKCSDFGMDDIAIEQLFLDLDTNSDGKISRQEFTRGWSNLKQQMGGTTTPRLHGLEDIPEDAAVVSEPEPELEPEPEPEQQPKAKPKPDQIFRPLWAGLARVDSGACGCCEGEEHAEYAEDNQDAMTPAQ